MVAQTDPAGLSHAVCGEVNSPEIDLHFNPITKQWMLWQASRLCRISVIQIVGTGYTPPACWWLTSYNVAR